MADFPRITRNPTVMGGRPCIRDTQIPVSAVMALVATGRTITDAARMLPTLEPEDVREAMAYAAWWVDEPAQPQAGVKHPHIFPSVSAMLARRVPEFTAPGKQPEEIPAQEESPDPAPAPTRTHFFPPVHPRTRARQDPENELEEEANNPEELAVEGVVTGETQIPDESLELFHPAYPDSPTVMVTRHGLFDRRWHTNVLAWSDIEAIERRTGHKHIHILLRNPQYYISAMPLFQRICTQVKLALGLRTFHLDTASLGIRTKDLFFTANRLWHLHRGKTHYRKKRRVRIGKKPSRDSYWQKYLPK
ncbi:MAG: DUF433 domain-containing protein [Chthoniobacteraceae bacterium]|nr:DUF433 domain-containing protein [Chthoniobacteraceae bacterium]